MPTYGYKCEACGHEFDQFQSITAKPIRKCPECGKTQVKRLLGTGAGIIFKGSGFYQTDYRSDSYTKAAGGDKGSSTTKDSPKKDSPSGSTPSPKPTESKSKTDSLKKSA
jgi:putative FmdB family regulatory protein